MVEAGVVGEHVAGDRRADREGEGDVARRGRAAGRRAGSRTPAATSSTPGDLQRARVAAARATRGERARARAPRRGRWGRRRRGPRARTPPRAGRSRRSPGRSTRRGRAGLRLEVPGERRDGEADRRQERSAPAGGAGVRAPARSTFHSACMPAAAREQEGVERHRGSIACVAAGSRDTSRLWSPGRFEERDHARRWRRRPFAPATLEPRASRRASARDEARGDAGRRRDRRPPSAADR